MRLTIVAAALMLTACIQSEQTTPQEREAIRILQSKRDVQQATLQGILAKLNAQYQAMPEVKAAVALDEQIAKAKADLAKRCSANETLEQDPSKADNYLKCVPKTK